MSASFTTKPLEDVLSFSFLDPEEFHLLKPIFDEYNAILPLKSVSQIAIATDETTNEIVGFYCFQLLPHAEPLWIHPNFRNKGIWVKLVEMIYPLTERFSSPTFIHATTPEVEEMCKRLGLTKVTYPVYIKEKI